MPEFDESVMLTDFRWVWLQSLHQEPLYFPDDCLHRDCNLNARRIHTVNLLMQNCLNCRASPGTSISIPTAHRFGTDTCCEALLTRSRFRFIADGGTAESWPACYGDSPSALILPH